MLSCFSLFCFVLFFVCACVNGMSNISANASYISSNCGDFSEVTYLDLSNNTDIVLISFSSNDYIANSSCAMHIVVSDEDSLSFQPQTSCYLSISINETGDLSVSDIELRHEFTVTSQTSLIWQTYYSNNETFLFESIPYCTDNVSKSMSLFESNSSLIDLDSTLDDNMQSFDSNGWDSADMPLFPININITSDDAHGTSELTYSVINDNGSFSSMNCLYNESFETSQNLNYILDFFPLNSSDIGNITIDLEVQIEHYCQDTTTSEPTMDPSMDPSTEPTMEPTMEPTVGPSIIPTKSPTDKKDDFLSLYEIGGVITIGAVLLLMCAAAVWVSVYLDFCGCKDNEANHANNGGNEVELVEVSQSVTMKERMTNLLEWGDDERIKEHEKMLQEFEDSDTMGNERDVT